MVRLSLLLGNHDSQTAATVTATAKGIIRVSNRGSLPAAACLLYFGERAGGSVNLRLHKRKPHKPCRVRVLSRPHSHAGPKSPQFVRVI